MNPIQKKCVVHARSLGLKPHKMSTDFEVGWPDYLFIGKVGLTIFVEFKRPGEPLRPAQRRKIEQFAELGHTIFVIDNVDAFKELMRMTL